MILEHARRFWLPVEGFQTLGDLGLLELKNPEMTHYLAKVLRCRVGDRLIGVDPGGLGAMAVEVIALENRQLTLRHRADWVPPPLNPLLPLTLAVALIKEERWEWLLQKATELGVQAIQPLMTERTTASTTVSPTRLRRWQTIVETAALQSEGLCVPEILPVASFRDWLSASQAGLVLRERSGGVVRLGREAVPVSSPAILCAGPEGGWSPSELSGFELAQWQGVSLGSRILRSETAAIAGLALVVPLLEDA